TLLARAYQGEIVMLFSERNEAQSRGVRDGGDRHAPIGAMLCHGRGDRVVRARLIPVTVRPAITEQPVDQDARAGTLVAVDHDAGGVRGSGSDRFLRTRAFEAL